MSGGKEEARVLLAQEPGRVNCQAVAADTQIVAQRKPARHTGGTPYTGSTKVDCALAIVVSGCVQWALNQLRKAGAMGCKSIDNPSPRMAAYDLSLRGMGFEIESITEAPERDHVGRQARNALRSGVSLGRNWGAGATKLQFAFLMRAHGLTEAQAHALAVLIWGAM